MVFYGLDWNTRKHAMRGDKGCLPNAELYDFPGGTYQWLESRLKKLDFFDRQIVFFATPRISYYGDTSRLDFYF